MHPFQKSGARPESYSHVARKVGAGEDLTVIFVRRQACLAGQELLLVTAITFPHPRSQPTSYSPLRAVHISCKGARITSAGYCVHGYPMEGASANNILSKA
ncbi:hypothetical protein Bca4012_103146 [Brassica carinata]